MKKFAYDVFDRIEMPTFILSNVYHHHIGVLNNIDMDSIKVNFNMNSQQEVSFDIYKELNGEQCELWDEIKSLRYIYIPEHKEYYCIDSKIDDSNLTVKHITLSSASEYELSNKIIRSLELNTDVDILRADRDKTGQVPAYAPNVLYNPDDTDNSILHRVLADKAPDWSIKHVDSTIKDIQRTFSISNAKIYDVLTKTIGDEYDCLFQFDSVNRQISAYDLLNKCNTCGERGEFTTKCTKCGGTSIHKGYGKDTHIFITYNNFSEKVSIDGNESSVKNCFYVEGGDDTITSRVRLFNPNGSQYIYNFSQDDYDDMPEELTEKLIQYQEDYDAVLPHYTELTNGYTNAKNDHAYYKTTMMPRLYDIARWKENKGYNVGDACYVKTLPTWCHLECIQAGISGDEEFDASFPANGEQYTDGTVIWEVKKNIVTLLPAEKQYENVENYFKDNMIYFLYDNATLAQVNREVVNIGNLQINNIFRIEVVEDDGKNTLTGNVWKGNIKVYNSGNTEDTYYTETPMIVRIKKVNKIYEYTDYMQTNVEKRLNDSDGNFTKIFDIEIPRNETTKEYIPSKDTVFPEALKEYAYDSLKSFYDTYGGCIDTLISNGIKDKNSKYMNWNVYDVMYTPYSNRRDMIGKEMEKRRETVEEYRKLYEDYLSQMNEIHDTLNLQEYLGEELYNIFWNYIREDTYQNSNYISTALSEIEISDNANQLTDKAYEELRKACELQITIQDSVKNLLNTEEFKSYKDKFNIGDYIVVEVDDKLYRLRLINASYSYSNPSDISFTFSNATRVEDYFADAQDVINSAKSIGGSYNAVVHQVEKNSEVTNEVTGWMEEGLSSATTTISNNDHEEITIDKNGITAKEYDDVNGVYSNEQMRITHNMLAFTDDNWETTKTALGKTDYSYYDENHHPVDDTGYGLNAQFVTAGYITGGQIIGSDIYSSNYIPGSRGSHIAMDDGSFDLAGGGFTGSWNPSTGKYDLNYHGKVEGVVDVGVGSDLGVWTVYNDGLYANNGSGAVLKSSNIKITGNMTAADYVVGTGTGAYNLKNKITTIEGSIVDVEANPTGATTDTLEKIKIGNTIYEISGGGGSGNVWIDNNDQTITVEVMTNGDVKIFFNGYHSDTGEDYAHVILPPNMQPYFCSANAGSPNYLEYTYAYDSDTTTQIGHVGIYENRIRIWNMELSTVIPGTVWGVLYLYGNESQVNPYVAPDYK